MKTNRIPLLFHEEDRGPNFATFHFRHVSDEEQEEGANTSAIFPFRHVSDDEETKKNTPRFEMEDKNLNLVARTSSARKLTYSSEDIKRLAAQAELLVLSSSRRRRLRPSEARSAAKRQNPELLWDGSDSNSNTSSSDSESRRTGLSVVRRRSSRSQRQRQRTEWRKSLPTSLEHYKISPTHSMDMSVSSDSWTTNSSLNNSTNTNCSANNINVNNSTTDSCGSIRNKNCFIDVNSPMYNTNNSTSLTNTTCSANNTNNTSADFRVSDNGGLGLPLLEDVENSGRPAQSEAEEDLGLDLRDQPCRGHSSEEEEEEGRSSVLSSDSQQWDKEEYLSECYYEERVDEEGIRNILSLGEDYREILGDEQSLSGLETSMHEDEELEDEEDAEEDDREEDGGEREESRGILDEEGASLKHSSLTDLVRAEYDHVQRSFANLHARGLCPRSVSQLEKLQNMCQEYSSLIHDVIECKDSSKQVTDLLKRWQSLESHIAARLQLNRDFLSLQTSVSATRKKLEACKERYRRLEANAEGNLLSCRAERVELARLKTDIFQCNLAVHRLMAEDDDQTAALEESREAVIDLYSLWAEASSSLSLGKETDQGQRGQAAEKRPKRRRKQRSKREDQGTAHPEDSGYSEAASCADPMSVRLWETLDSGLSSPVEAKTTVLNGDGGSGRSSSVGLGWIGRVGRAALYTCLLAAALLPLVVYSARPPQCCEFMYPTPHWIHFQYVNGPPPI